VTSLLLADLRVDVNLADNDHITPLWVASQRGHLAVVQRILASGREIDLKAKAKNVTGNYAWNKKTAVEVAKWSAICGPWPSEEKEGTAHRSKYCPLIATLLDSYKQNPKKARSQLQQQLELEGKISVFPIVPFGFFL